MTLINSDGSYRLGLKTTLSGLFLWPALKLFRAYPALGATIAASMVSDYLKQFLRARPIVARFSSIVTYVAFVIASFYFAEVLVGLIAVAFVVETELIWTAIYDEYQKFKPNSEEDLVENHPEDLKYTFRKMVQEVEAKFDLD